MKFETIATESAARRYREAGWWEDRTILHYFDAAVAETPAATAVVAPFDRRMTFAELDEESRRVAAHFASFGLGKGDVVSIQLPNWAEFVVAHIAATRLGAVT